MMIWLIFRELLNANGAVNEGRGRHITVQKTSNKQTKPKSPNQQQQHQEHEKPSTKSSSLCHCTVMPLQAAGGDVAPTASLMNSA